MGTSPTLSSTIWPFIEALGLHLAPGVIRPILQVTILAALLFAVLAPAQSKPFVSIDIDWTAFYTLQPGQKVSAAETYLVEGKTYLPTPHLREVIQVLRAKGFGIGFISGGKPSRNHTLLSLYYLNLHENLADVSIIKSSTDLFPVPGVREDDYFSNRFKKDLRVFGVDPAMMAHVDDMPWFAFNSEQARSFVTLSNTYDYIEKFVEGEPTPSGRSAFQPKNYRSWVLEQNKLLWVLGILLSAHEDWARMGGDFRDHVFRHSRNSSGEFLDRDGPESIQYFQKGIQAIEHFSKDKGRIQDLKTLLILLPSKGCGNILRQRLSI